MKKTLFLLGLLLLLVPRVILAATCGDSCSDQGSCTDVINACNAQITALQNKANTLSNQIAQFNAQISLMEVKIESTKEQIKLLAGRITQVQGSLDDLTKAFSARAVATYKMFRTDGSIYLLLSSHDISDAISKFHYLQEAENADQNLLTRLKSAQVTYETSKKQSETLQKQLEDQQTNLNVQKIAKAQLLADTRGSEANYQKLLLQAQSQLAAFKNFVAGQGGASILNNQTVCNDWGCYYNQRDSQWGNKFLGGSTLTVKEYGCLVSSSAMVASFYKKTLTPSDIAASNASFFTPDSGTALLWRDITVNGIRIVRNSIGANTANIDSELAAGRPVIVGLYNGPAHFIVIKSGSNGNYIMNDPFMENGHDVSFNSKYSVSNITDVENVSVQ